MDNLMTIYDPLGEQYIIKGGKLIYMNEQYNNKINYLKSKMNKNGHTISNRIRDLLIKRENKIDNCFNQITNKIYELYNKKDKIIIGQAPDIKNDYMKYDRRMKATHTNMDFILNNNNFIIIKYSNVFYNKHACSAHRRSIGRCKNVKRSKIDFGRICIQGH